MKSKFKSKARIALFIALLINTPFLVNANEMTGRTGAVSGTPPVLYNKDNKSGHIDVVRKRGGIEDDDQLDINDSLSLAWRFFDGEGDEEITLPSVEWICTDTNNSRHVLATGTLEYIISPNDKACTIGVNLTPKTLTGAPQENTAIEIADISTYIDNDSIPDGPVNPHSINMTDYTVAPNNATARMTVPANAKLTTAFSGAQVQLETDNIPDEVTWSSSNDAVATVSDTGLVTFKGKGAVKITARHNEQSVSMTLNPQLFFVMGSTNKTWDDAKTECEGMGGRLPTISELSDGTDIRNVPGNGLWEEWGQSIKDVPHSGVVFWSSSSNGVNSYLYAYLSDGHLSSNRSTVTEGFACILN